jgi:hypothetical protein
MPRMLWFSAGRRAVERLAGEKLEALGQLRADPPGDLVGLLYAEQLDVEIFGAALDAHRAGRPEADFRLGMEAARVRNRQFRAPEGPQERGHGLEMGERRAAALLCVAHAQQRPLFR